MDGNTIGIVSLILGIAFFIAGPLWTRYIDNRRTKKLNANAAATAALRAAAVRARRDPVLVTLEVAQRQERISSRAHDATHFYVLAVLLLVWVLQKPSLINSPVGLAATFLAALGTLAVGHICLAQRSTARVELATFIRMVRDTPADAATGTPALQGHVSTETRGTSPRGTEEGLETGEQGAQVTKQVRE